MASLRSGTRYLLSPLSRLGGTLYDPQKQDPGGALPHTAAPTTATRDGLLEAAAAAAAQAQQPQMTPPWGSGARSHRAAYAPAQPPPGSAAASHLVNGAGGWDDRGLSIRVEDSAQHPVADHSAAKRPPGTIGASWQGSDGGHATSPRSMSPVPEQERSRDRNARFF